MVIIPNLPTVFSAQIKTWNLKLKHYRYSSNLTSSFLKQKSWWNKRAEIGESIGDGKTKEGGKGNIFLAVSELSPTTVWATLEPQRRSKTGVLRSWSWEWVGAVRLISFYARESVKMVVRTAMCRATLIIDANGYGKLYYVILYSFPTFLIFAYSIIFFVDYLAMPW